MNSPIEAIKQAVAENRTSDALSRLLELTQRNKQLHDAIHIVLAEFNDLTSQRLKGTIDNSEATRRLNVIHDKILVALGAFDSAGRVLPGSASVKKNTATSTLKTIAFSLLGAGSVVFLLGWWYYKTHDNDASIENQEIIYLFRETGIYLLIAGATSFVGYIIALVLKAIQK